MIECKRPQSNKKVSRSIKEATSQLIKHFKNYPRELARHGFIALDISVVMNPQRMFVIENSIGAIAHEVDTRFNRLLTEFKSVLSYRRDKRILGILAFAKVLAYNAPENCHISFLKVQPYLHPGRGTYEALLAENLCDRFRLDLP